MWTIYEMVGLRIRRPANRRHIMPTEWSRAMRNVAAGRESGEGSQRCPGRSAGNRVSTWPISAGRARATISRDQPRSGPVDGEQLTDEEIASFFVLLSVAGNDTTRAIRIS